MRQYIFVKIKTAIVLLLYGWPPNGSSTPYEFCTNYMLIRAVMTMTKIILHRDLVTMNYFFHIHDMKTHLQVLLFLMNLTITASGGYCSPM